LNLKSLDDLVDLIKEKLAPFEERLKSLKENLIDQFGRFLPQGLREALKKRISDLADSLLRQPLMNRINALLDRARREFGGSDAETVADPVLFSEIQNRFQDFLSGDLFKRIEGLLRPLEQNLREKLSELNIKSLDDLADLIKEKLAPFEERLKSLKENLIDRFGKLVSGERREALKKRISDLADSLLRQPLMNRIKALLERARREL